MAKRPRPGSDRVTLDVAGTLFHTTASMLRQTSTYFAAQFSHEWSDSAGELFLDRDADAFKVLLSCMRNDAVLLPEDDADLFRRVLLEAEYFGVDKLVNEVKAKAILNAREGEVQKGPTISYSREQDATEEEHAKGRRAFLFARRERNNGDRDAANQKLATYFDDQFGGLRQACSERVLPDMYLMGERKKVTIKHLIPAHPNDHVVFSQYDEDEDDDDTDERRRVGQDTRAVAYAVCEDRNGHNYVDAVVATRFDAIEQPNPAEIQNREDGKITEVKLDGFDQQLMLASEYCRKRIDWPGALCGIHREGAESTADPAQGEA